MRTGSRLTMSWSHSHHMTHTPGIQHRHDEIQHLSTEIQQFNGIFCHQKHSRISSFATIWLTMHEINFACKCATVKLTMVLTYGFKGPHHHKIGRERDQIDISNQVI